MKRRRKRLKKYLEIESRIAFQHVDPWQVMWYGNYLHYFELVRMEILRLTNMLPQDLASEGVICPIMNLNVDYKRAALCDEEIIIRGGVEKSQSASLDFVFEIYGKQKMDLIAVGTTKQIFLNESGAMLFYIPDFLKSRVHELTEKFQN